MRATMIVGPAAVWLAAAATAFAQLPGQTARSPDARPARQELPQSSKRVRASRRRHVVLDVVVPFLRLEADQDSSKENGITAVRYYDDDCILRSAKFG